MRNFKKRLRPMVAIDIAIILGTLAQASRLRLERKSAITFVT